LSKTEGRHGRTEGDSESETDERGCVAGSGGVTRHRITGCDDPCTYSLARSSVSFGTGRHVYLLGPPIRVCNFVTLVQMH
jgi:hypothetical protein